MKYQIKIKSLNKQTILIYQKFLINVFNKTNIKYTIFNLPIEKKRVTLLKSTHVNKSAREQFELKKFSYILQINEKINSYLLKFLFLNKPRSVSVCFKNV